MNKYKAIIDLIRREDVTLFVGSGCSIASKAPSAKDLTDKLWTLLESDYQDNDIRSSLQEVSENLVVQEGNDRTKLNKVLVDSFTNLTPSSFHQLILRIPHFHTIITTNYDSLIETAYTFEYFQVIASDSELASADSRKVQLLKIHGDTKHLEDIVITKTDYRHVLEAPRNGLLWSRITTEFTSKHIVFVGYSADDQNILNLIEHIKKKTSGSIKQMFLIAPALKKVQEKRMKDLGVTIINGTGEDFLETTISTLKESFGEDKYNNISSQDTLARFALLSGILFSFENNGKHTSITRWRSSNGNPCPLKMNFSTKSLDIIGGRTPTTITEIVKGFGVPMYALTPEELATFRMSVNDLRINGENEMQKVLIGPAINDLDIAFTSRDHSIDCRCKAKRYSENGICHILIPTPIYNLELKIDFSDISKSAFTGNLTTKLNEGRFEDLAKAIQWTKMLASLQDNVGLTLHLGPLQLEDLNFSKTDETQPRYKDWLDYCLNLSDIEIAANTILPHYDGFTPDNFFYSKIIRSYLRHEAIIDKPRKEYKSFTLDIDKGNFQGTGEYVARVVTRINGPVSLCGLQFSIAEERVLMMHCRIESVEFVDNEKERLHITNLQDTIQYEYCDEDEPDRLIGEGNSEQA